MWWSTLNGAVVGTAEHPNTFEFGDKGHTALFGATARRLVPLEVHPASSGQAPRGRDIQRPGGDAGLGGRLPLDNTRAPHPSAASIAEEKADSSACHE